MIDYCRLWGLSLPNPPHVQWSEQEIRCLLSRPDGPPRKMLKNLTISVNSWTGWVPQTRKRNCEVVSHCLWWTQNLVVTGDTVILMYMYVISLPACPWSLLSWRIWLSVRNCDGCCPIGVRVSRWQKLKLFGVKTHFIQGISIAGTSHDNAVLWNARIVKFWENW